MCEDINDKICPRQKFFGVKNCHGQTNDQIDQMMMMITLNYNY